MKENFMRKMHIEGALTSKSCNTALNENEKKHTLEIDLKRVQIHFD